MDCSALANPDHVAALLTTHPALADALLGGLGFEPPPAMPRTLIKIDDDSQAALALRGINVLGAVGYANYVLIGPAPAAGLELMFNGTQRNLVVLDNPAGLSGRLNFLGDDNAVVLGASSHANGVYAQLRHQCAGLYLGAGASSPGTNYWVEGPGRCIAIGADLMASWGVWVRTADGHGLVDLASGTLLNPSRSVRIGRHVWLGQDALVMPGVQIGAGTVIGARAVVTRDTAPACIAVGSPARMVRRDVSWTRPAQPDAATVMDLQSAASAWRSSDALHRAAHAAISEAGGLD